MLIVFTYSNFLWQMNWVCQDSWVGPFLQSIFYMGSVFGTIVYGWTADMFGRYPSFIASNVILAIGGICLPLCNDIFCFASVRFVMGLNWAAFYSTMMVLGELSLGWLTIIFPSEVTTWFIPYSLGIYTKPEAKFCATHQSTRNCFRCSHYTLATQVLGWLEAFSSDHICSSLVCPAHTSVCWNGCIGCFINFISYVFVIISAQCTSLSVGFSLGVRLIRLWKSSQRYQRQMANMYLSIISNKT